jgi:O-antigen ligase
VNRLLGRDPLRFVQAPTLVIMGVGASAAVAAAFYAVDVEQGVFPKPFLGLLGLAGAIVLFNVTPERLFIGWLALAPLLQGLPDTSWAKALDLGLYVAPALVLLVHTLGRGGRRSAVSWIDFLPAAYLLLVVGSMAFTTDLLQTSPASSIKAIFRNVAMGPLLYYFVAFGAARILTATRVVRVLLISCAIQGAMATVEFPTKWNLWHDAVWHGDNPSRSVATLQNPAALGAFLGAGLVLALSVLAWDGPRELRRVSLIVLAVSLPGLAFTFTRGPVAATLAVGLVVALLKGRTRFMSVVVVGATALALVIAWPTISRSSLYRDRVTNSRNVQARVVLQDWSIRLWKQKPILGWGYQSFDRVKNSANFDAGLLPVALGLDSTSHNTYLTVLVEYGGFGLLLFLAPFAVTLLSSVRRARAPSPDRWLFVGASAAVAVILLAGMTSDHRFFSFLPAVPWLLLGLLRRAGASRGDTSES